MSESTGISIRVISLANRTTHVELRDGKRIFGEKEDKSLKSEVHADFAEFLPEGLKLDIPPRTCSTGHRLELELEVTAPAKRMRFSAQGVVEQAEVFPHSHDNITVRFTKHDSTIWSMILSLFETQQHGVASLFKKLKGTEP